MGKQGVHARECRAGREGTGSREEEEREQASLCVASSLMGLGCQYSMLPLSPFLKRLFPAENRLPSPFVLERDSVAQSPKSSGIKVRERS